MEQIILQLNDVLAEETIVTNGAGNYAAWLHDIFNINHLKPNWPQLRVYGLRNMQLSVLN